LAFLRLFALFTCVILLNLSLCNVKIIYPHFCKRYPSLLKISSSPLIQANYFKPSYITALLWHDPTRHDKPASGVIGCNKRRKEPAQTFSHWRSSMAAVDTLKRTLCSTPLAYSDKTMTHRKVKCRNIMCTLHLKCRCEKTLRSDLTSVE